MTEPGRRDVPPGAPPSRFTPESPDETETFNPWSVVNLVFHHLADNGLHPVLGEHGDPGPHAAGLLTALGIQPAAEGNRQVSREVQDQLAQLRAAVFGTDQPE
jgi:hypothetical protein